MAAAKPHLENVLFAYTSRTAVKIFLNVNGEEKDILSLSKEESFAARKRVQMIFQDPYASLNPVKNILSAFDEPLKAHGVKSAAERKEIAVNALESVNLQADYIYRFPHEFSGGQRQRIWYCQGLGNGAGFDCLR